MNWPFCNQEFEGKEFDDESPEEIKEVKWEEK